MELMMKVLQLFQRPLVRRQQSLMRSRGDYRKQDFCSFFDVVSRSPSLVWDALCSEAVVPGFRPKPNDDLQEVFGLAEEDLDDFVLSILRMCGLRVPAPEETSALPPVRTVADLVLFVSRLETV